MIKQAKKIKCTHPRSNIIVHCYFLAYNTLLFFNGFLCKIRMSNKIKQYIKRSFKIITALKKITSSVKRSICVCRCSGFCISCKCIKVFTFKKLVFKKVGYTLRYNSPFIFIRTLKFGINRTVVSAENCIG